MTIKPWGDYILITPLKPEATTSFGLELPEDARQKTTLGKVVSWGPKVKNPIRTDLTVAYRDYAYEELTIEGKDYLLIKEEAITAALED